MEQELRQELLAANRHTVVRYCAPHTYTHAHHKEEHLHMHTHTRAQSKLQSQLKAQEEQHSKQMELMKVDD